MPVLQGLPDFGVQIGGESASIFAPLGAGSYSVLPQQMDVATDASGNPRFLLEIEQSLGDFSASGQFSTLDFQLTADYPLETALATARGLSQGATVTPLTIDSGFARLYPTTSLVTPASDLLAPIQLGLGGEAGARWTMRLSADAGEVLKASLTGVAGTGAASSVVPLGARVEYVASGVAPRVPLAVEFQPATLVGALLQGNASRMVAQPSLVSVIAAPGAASGAALPMTVIGSLDGQAVTFAQAMQDRLLSAFASLTPAPGPGDPPYFLFQDATTLPTATVHWDLSQPAVVSRAWVILFDPISSLQALTAKNGTAALIKYISIPPVPVGFWNVNVTTNLPSNRRGVAVIGANLESPPAPPFRPAAIEKQLVFTEPDDTAAVELQLSIREALNFTIAGYAVFAEAGAVRQDVAPARAWGANWVQMRQTDFPVRFLYLSVDSRVAALADIGVSLTYALDGTTHSEQLTLTSTAPNISVGVPQSAAEVQMALVATPHDGSAPLALPTPGTDQVRIDPTSFATYGPHTISVSCTMNLSDPPLFIDLIAQCQLNNSSITPAKMALTSDSPVTSWSYVALTPFQAGYCYRLSAVDGGQPGAWSRPFPPDSSLTLLSDGSTSTDINTATGATPASTAAAAPVAVTLTS